MSMHQNVIVMLLIFIGNIIIMKVLVFHLNLNHVVIDNSINIGNAVIIMHELSCMFNDIMSCLNAHDVEYDTVIYFGTKSLA